MNKTLHKKLTVVSVNKKPVMMVESGTWSGNEQLIELMQEMKGAWQEAASDLLQPRPEAVAQLLKKVLH